MNKNVFKRSLEIICDQSLKSNSEKFLKIQQDLETEIAQNKILSQEQLDMKASQLTSQDFLWAYAILSAEKNPYARHKTFARLYDIIGFPIFAMIAGCIRYTYPKAFKYNLISKFILTFYNKQWI